jgi:O-antigen ligase
MEKLVKYPLGKDIFDILIIIILLKTVFLEGREPISSSMRKIAALVIIIIPLTYTSLWIGSFKLGLSYPISFDNPQLIDWKNFIIMPILFFITIKQIKNTNQMMILVSIMILAVLLMDIYYYQNARWYSHEHFSYDKRNVGSTFSYLGPNEIASFYAQVAIMIIGMSLCLNMGFQKMFLLGTALFTFYPILFLYSRGAYAATLAGLIFIGIIKKRIILILLLILIVSWQSILPTSVVERVEMTKSDGKIDASVTSRFELWGEALSHIKINPVTGLGFGSTKLLGFKTGETHNRRDIHNGYIEILVEQGIIGLIVFMMIFIEGLKRGWELYKESDDSFLRGLGLGLVGMIIVILISNLFGDRWSYLNVMGYFWITLGLVVKAKEYISINKNDMKAI